MILLRITVLCIILLSTVGCKSSVELTLDDFILSMEAGGFALEEVEYAQAAENKKRFLVTPGNMYISVETMADEQAAKEKTKKNNEDIREIKTNVKRDGTALSDMGDLPEAFNRYNLILYVPVNYIVYYEEAALLVGIFKGIK